jgi:hypothetical protein
MTPDYVWILNPDCERELSAKHSYAVRAAFRTRISERRPLFEGLVQGEPMFFSHELDASTVIGSEGTTSRALLWCPTPHAVSLLAGSGLDVPAHPPADTLRRVHDKGFLTTNCGDLTLPGRRIIDSVDQWSAYQDEMRCSLRTKRLFGYAGKGQRVWTPGGKDDPTWLSDSLRQGGFIAEPNVAQAEELSIHGFVDGRGTLLGEICRLSTDRAGAPVAIAQVKDDVLSTRFEGGEPVRAVAQQAAHRLAAAGYWGPFGIDLLWVEGRPCLIDLNPRFTLGWSIGMGKARADGIRRALAPALDSPGTDLGKA